MGKTKDTKGHRRDFTYNKKFKYIIDHCDLKGQNPLNGQELCKLFTRINEKGEKVLGAPATFSAWRRNINPLPKEIYNEMLPVIYEWLQDQLVETDKRRHTLMDLYKTFITLLHNGLD